MDAGGAIEVSVVVPAYREAANLEPLVRRLYAAFDAHGGLAGPAARALEVIVVDDSSPDDTPAVMARVARRYPNARLEVRTSERGLSSAVLRGFDLARGDVLLVMDADLQHPPETAPKLAAALRSRREPVEFVLGTRYGLGAAVDKDWPLHRRVLSAGARALALPLSPLSDPMSGFFALRRDVYARGRARVDGLGFKIALELFVKCAVASHAEVPFSFGTRAAGESKLDGSVMVRYIQHLLYLYWFKYRFVCALVLLLTVLIVVLGVANGARRLYLI
jgi:dolichol-phosphate mannosyltransferase